MQRNLWTREELIVTLSLYFQLPFGRLNHSTPEVVQLAAIIGRSSNSVALRLVNFAACDPYILATGRHGMAAGAKTCQPIWDEYYNDRERLFVEAEIIKAQMRNITVEKALEIEDESLKGEMKERFVKQRVNQNVFRTMILNNYDWKCAVTGIDIPELLIASHIIPWAAEEKHRLDPENGICLSPLYDRVFDRGLITVTPEYRIELSKELKEHSKSAYYQRHFADIENKQILLPEEHKPNLDFLEYHYNNIFAKHN